MTTTTEDRYTAARDADGGIRLSNGRGALIANADHTRADVVEWFVLSQPGNYREGYRAALALLDKEAGEDDTPRVHPDGDIVHLEDQPTPVEGTATCLACGTSVNTPYEQRLRDLTREMRRQLGPLQRQADKGSVARALVGNLRAAARHPHKGPDDTDASMLLAAAGRLEGGYEPGGSNTKQTVARVLRAVAAILESNGA